MLLVVGCTQPPAETPTPGPTETLPTETPESTSTPETELLKVVGQNGGATQAVAVQGNYAYVGVGLRLSILDITSLAHPMEIGATEAFEGYIEDVAVVGNTAFVAAGGAGLYIVDISDPANPAVVGSYDTPGYAESVTVAGKYAYVADGPAGLRVVDIEDLDHPAEVGQAYSLNYAFDVAVDSKRSYVASAGAGLLVADISDPVNPREIGNLDTPGYAYGVVVFRDTAYVADGWGGLRVINISQPSTPVEGDSTDTPGWAFDVAIKDGVAYVADGWGGVRLIDVRDPTGLAELGSYNPAGGLAAGLVTDGKTVYVADRTAGLRVLDVHDPTRPAQVSLYSPMGFADDVVVTGNYAYVAAGPYGLRVVDITDPSRPREVGAYDTQGYAWCIAVAGNFAYVSSLPADEHPERLHIIDMSDPTRPVQVGYMEPQHDRPRNMVIEEGIIYSVDEWGLQLIDISNPLTPNQLSFIQLTGTIPDPATVDVAVSGDLAYVAQSEGGLKIVDVSNPRAPVLVGAYDQDILKVMSVAVVGNYAYLGDHGRLLTVDVSDPRNPKGMGFDRVPGVTDEIVVAGNTLYLATGTSGVQVVNISDRRAPTIAGSRYVSGYASGLTLSGNYVYVAAEDGGVFILERATDSVTASGQSADRLGLERTGKAAAGLTSQAVARQKSVDASPVSLAMRTLSLPSPAASWSPERPTTSTGSHLDRASSFSSGTVLTVTITADSGPGTLRWALENAHSGDTITFDPAVFPPTNPAVIKLSNPLPTIDGKGTPNLTLGGLTIDASNAGVILDGCDTPPGTTGLKIFLDGNVIKGLQIKNFGVGVQISNAKDNIIGGDRTQGTGLMGEGNLISGNGGGVGIFGPDATGNKVIGNYIGTDITGTSALGNRDRGISITGGASQNLIGGMTPGERNVISGNGMHGVVLDDEGTIGNHVFGNYIGLDASGTRTLGHCSSGVHISEGASGNIIGGIAPGERNVIAGNGRQEVGLMVGAHDNVIVGNYIGTDAYGSQNLGISTSAVTMELGPFNNVIQGNVISTNGGAGVMISDWGTWGNEVIGNFIGVDATGTSPLGGTGGSIQLNASFNKIGGTTPAEKNVIGGNGIVGIKVGFHSMTDVLVLGNFIGTDVSGTQVVGNNGHGISITEGTHHSFIGGATKGERNIISGNRGSGVALEGIGVRHNFVIGNHIGTDAGGITNLSNESGISIEGAEHNFVQANLIAYNEKRGLFVKPGQGNSIHHNSFIRNGANGSDGGTDNRWDDGLRGNYWSDYTGKDNNGDGIGDTPQPVPPDGVDNYPLMKPYG